MMRNVLYSIFEEHVPPSQCISSSRSLGIGNVGGQQTTTIWPKGEMRTILQQLAPLLACIDSELHRPDGPSVKKMDVYDYPTTVDENIYS